MRFWESRRSFEKQLSGEKKKKSFKDIQNSAIRERKVITSQWNPIATYDGFFLQR